MISILTFVMGFLVGLIYLTIKMATMSEEKYGEFQHKLDKVTLAIQELKFRIKNL